ncbi:MAG: hypothetical protein JW913_14800 [Chitinispirillaceae bacterium]|nr:hypothetical protein [Chitinispirillaceae bacterium]
MNKYVLTLSAVCFLFFANQVQGQWVSTGGPEGGHGYTFAVSGDTIFVGTDNSYGDGHVYRSTDNGSSWTRVNNADANTITTVTALAVSGDNIFAGTYGNGVWRRPLSEMTSVLPPNRRNNPLQTRIRVNAYGYLHSDVMVNYSIQARCFVRLGIYTISGEKVVLLQQGEQSPGEYGIRLENGAIPAGLYVCCFQAGIYQESNILMVMK